ncbi:MAG: hypothetical protein ACK50J_09430 [Planctomyces sp.]
MGILTETAAKIHIGRRHAVSESTLAFLTGLGLPLAISEDLSAATADETLSLYRGGIRVIPSSALESLNNDDLYRPWLQDGYLTIASGACGDPIAIDILTTRMAYIIHDEMNHLVSDIVPSNHVIHTPLSYHDFWNLATRYDIALHDPQIGESGLEVWLSLTGYKGVPVDAERAEARWGRGSRSNA